MCKSGAQPPTCITVQGVSYTFWCEGLGWYDSRVSCEALGGQLASFVNVSVLEALVEQSQQSNIVAKCNYCTQYYIGAVLDDFMHGNIFGELVHKILKTNIN